MKDFASSASTVSENTLRTWLRNRQYVSDGLTPHFFPLQNISKQFWHIPPHPHSGRSWSRPFNISGFCQWMAAGTTTWWLHAAAGCIPPPPQTHRLTEFLQLCCSACWYAETARFLRPAALRNLRPWIDVFSEIIRISCEHGNIRLRRPDRHASEHSSWYSEEKSMSHSFPANMITSRYAGITETHPCTAANLLSDFFAYLLLPVFSNCLSQVFKTSPVSSKH